MANIRVLVVDDSVVVRRLITEVLAGDREIEIAGIAANGYIALSKVDQLTPDLITLDIEMPEMDGLAMLRELRKRHPRLPVIMFSAQTERGAATTLDALALGASDYVTKPGAAGSANAARECIRTALIPRIKALCRRKGTPDSSDAPLNGPASPRPGFRRARRAGERSRTEIVAIGVSTGGPNALTKIIPTIPANFPVPIVIVQHMPPIFTRLLAERLDALSSLSVKEGLAGAYLLPGQIWIAPGGYHMAVEKSADGMRIGLNQDAPENSCRPAVDVLFRSVGRAYGEGALAVILTGMGQDGLRGCRLIHEAGGRVWVQDENSSVVWSMPGAVAEAGLADKILPLGQFGDALTRRVCGQNTQSHCSSDTRIGYGDF